MSLVKSFSKIVTYAKKEAKKKRYGEFTLAEEASKDGNMLFFGDNLDVMKHLLYSEKMVGGIQQIYIDPPFFSKANYDAWVKVKDENAAAAAGAKKTEPKGINAKDVEKVKKRAYEDVWDEGMEEYLKMLATRFMLMKELLSDSGTIWVHLDWHGSHYVKIILDEIFGEKNFVNEIVWTYKSGGSSKKHFARKHDTILVYSKTDKYYLSVPKEKSYNRDYKPYRFKNVEEFQDELGWYTMVNMKDVWAIDMVGRTSSERNGYATQKPETLVERIIAAGSREGDTVADFFAGSATLAAVAKRLERKWICCDNSEVAIDCATERLKDDAQIKMDM